MSAGRTPPALPGVAERVRAASTLVVAPHYDDEVLGCGGLLAQLVEAGSVVRVLFLTDSAGDPLAQDGELAAPGGAGEPDDPEADPSASLPRTSAEDRAAYRRRRRAEADAVAAEMGLTGCDHLALPDGRLEDRLEDAVAGVRRALLAQRPDLVLVPSPLETTADHRAAFAALHACLAELSAEGRAEEVAGGLEVLVYELNHPAYPDLLVDVGAELPRIERAMELYASQQERHDYLSAALGLRRYRTLSLPAGVEAAEGYRRLALSDFTTRSAAQLVRHLGGVPELLEVDRGPLLSVVVRTRDRPALLAEALASLAAGSYRRAEVVLVNDGGEPPEVPAGFPLPLTRVDLPENRGRAAAADAGVEAAGGDYVCFLDDDDLAFPEHLETLAAAVSAPGVRVAYTDAAVAVYEVADGRGGERGWVCRERRLPYGRDFDRDLLALDNYVPFHTLAVERALFAEVGRFDPELPFFEDWDYLVRLSRLTAFHRVPRVTCEYRIFRGAAHHVLGERPRERADFLEMKAHVLAKHRGELSPERLASAAATLAADRVEAREEAAAHRRELSRAERREAELAERYHRLNGHVRGLEERRAALEGQVDELHAHVEELGGEVRRLNDVLAESVAETERLRGVEAELREVVGEQEEHLGRTYGEIERLNGVVRAMETTRLWRLGRRIQRLLGRG